MKPPRLNLYHLMVFYFVAREKSFSAASEKLFLSQPAVTLHVKALERNARVKLLDVRRKRVYLTKAGEALFQYAEGIYEQVRNAERFLENLRESGLRIGAAVTFSALIGSVASRFEELFPNVKLRIKNAPSYQIVEELIDLQHDVAIVVNLNYRTRKLRAMRVSEGEKLVLVTSPSSPIFLKKELKLADLRGYPLLLPPEKSATREILLRRFEAEGSEVKPSILVETDYLECAKRLAEEGKGIALMHITNVEDEVAQGRLRIVPLVDELTVGASVLVRRDVPLPSAGSRFISLVKETFQRR